MVLLNRQIRFNSLRWHFAGTSIVESSWKKFGSDS